MTEPQAAGVTILTPQVMFTDYTADHRLLTQSSHATKHFQQPLLMDCGRATHMQVYVRSYQIYMLTIPWRHHIAATTP
jgi:hypothetical protein